MNLRKEKSPINNENEADFEAAMSLTKTLLLPFGLWPLDVSDNYKYFRPILITVGAILMLFIMIPQCLYTLVVVKDIKIRVKFIGSLSFSLMIIFKYIMIAVRKSKVAECLQIIAEDWRHSNDVYHKSVMIEKARFGRNLIIISMILLYGGAMPYISIVPITTRPTVLGNVTYWPLPFPAYFHYFDPRIKPIYNVIYIVQCICGSMRYAITCGVYSIVIMSVMHIYSRVTIMASILQKLADTYNKKLLRQVVRQHLNFLMLAKKLENIFQEIAAVEVLGSIFNICFLGYYFITGFSERAGFVTITFVLLWSSFVFNIFILCYIGEILTEQCESVRFAAYKIHWYQFSGRDIRDAVLLISLKRRPVALTAGKMMTLSLETFTSIMKVAGSYLNMLRTMIANSN